MGTSGHGRGALGPVHIVLGVCSLMAAAVSVPVLANPLDAFGLGPKAIALGGAFTGLADDSAANYYNPAGLAQGDALRFDLGYTHADPTLRFNGGDADVDPAAGLSLGVVLPGEVLGRHVGASVGMLLLDDRITRVRSLAQQQPRFVLFDNRVQRLFIAANIAVELIDGLFFGGGLTFMADTSGRLDVNGVVSLSDSENTRLQGAVDVDIESTRYPQLGLLWAPDGPFSVGLVFRDEYYLSMQIGTLVTGDIYLDDPETDGAPIVEGGSLQFDSSNANLFSPMQLVLGASYDFGAVLVTADLGWYRWSRFRAPTADVVLTLDLGDLPFSIPESDPVLDPGFSDLMIPRIGVEADLFEGERFGLAGRAGYFFEDSPAPDQPGTTNYADAPKHGLSMGVGLRFSELTEVLPKPIFLDLSVLYLHLLDRDYHKDDPADLIGDYRIDGHVLSVSLQLGVLL